MDAVRVPTNTVRFLRITGSTVACRVCSQPFRQALLKDNVFTDVCPTCQRFAWLGPRVLREMTAARHNRRISSCTNV